MANLALVGCVLQAGDQLLRLGDGRVGAHGTVQHVLHPRRQRSEQVRRQAARLQQRLRVSISQQTKEKRTTP